MKNWRQNIKQMPWEYSWILSVIFSTPCSIVLDETGQGAAGGSWVKTKEMEKESPQ